MKINNQIKEIIGRQNFKFNLNCDYCKENRRKLSLLGTVDIELDEELEMIWKKLDELEEILNENK